MRVREETGSVDVIDGVEPRRFGAGVRGGSMMTVEQNGDDEGEETRFMCEVFDVEVFG